MKFTRLRNTILLLFVWLLLGSTRASAQTPLEPAQMPVRTSFYLVWRGAPSLVARKANALLSLWDDPGFAPVRSAMLENMLSSSGKEKSQQGLTRDELQEYSTLLDNSFVFGYLSEPEAPAAARRNAAAASEHPWNGSFFVYDRAGKEALLSKAVLRLRSGEKDAPQISQFAVGGVQALKIERKSGVTYWAEHGKYAVSANERSIFEEILGRLNGKSAAAASLGQSSAYQEAQPTLGGGLLEFFVRIPNLKDLASNATNAQGISVRPFLDAFTLDSLHSISGRMTLEGAKTRFQATVLGDTAPGSLFDLLADGQATPATLALLPADAVSYTETQINFLAIYALLKRAVRAALPPGQQGNTDMLEALAQARLGMPLADALALATGEISSLQTSPTLDPAKQVYMLGIRKKPETLKLMRTILGEQLTAERNEGDTTFLKISLRGGPSNAGVAQWNFYHLAVTPDLLLGASRSETLRDLLAHRSTMPGAPGLSSLPQFQAARAQFPEKLTGIGYFDLQKLDWQGMKDRWLAQAKKTAESQSPKAETPGKGFTVPDWLTHSDPLVFPRHLHTTSSASWKDAKGLHIDWWLD